MQSNKQGINANNLLEHVVHNKACTCIILSIKERIAHKHNKIPLVLIIKEELVPVLRVLSPRVHLSVTHRTL